MIKWFLILTFWLTCYAGNQKVFDGEIDRYLLIPGGAIHFYPLNSDRLHSFNGTYVIRQLP